MTGVHSLLACSVCHITANGAFLPHVTCKTQGRSSILSPCGMTCHHLSKNAGCTSLSVKQPPHALVIYDVLMCAHCAGLGSAGQNRRGHHNATLSACGTWCFIACLKVTPSD